AVGADAGERLRVGVVAALAAAGIARHAVAGGRPPLQHVASPEQLRVVRRARPRHADHRNGRLKRKTSWLLAGLAVNGARVRLAETSILGTGQPLASVWTLSLATTTVRLAYDTPRILYPLRKERASDARLPLSQFTWNAAGPHGADDDDGGGDESGSQNG
ncbi:hypothetical protein EE612_000169, partial [Oryza sativa]